MAIPGATASVGDVIGWSRTLSLSTDYAAALEENGVDGEILHTLKAADLCEIGISDEEDRKRVAAALGLQPAAGPPGPGSSVADVASWISSIGLTQDYSAHVRQNDVDGVVLGSLGKGDLKEALGISVFGDRRKVEIALGLAQAEPKAAAEPAQPAAPLATFRKIVLWVDSKFDHLEDFIGEMEKQLSVQIEKRTTTNSAKRVVQFYGGELLAVITNRQRGDNENAGFELAELVRKMWAQGEAATGGADCPPVIVMYSTSADEKRVVEADMKLARNFRELQRVLHDAAASLRK
eukprot:TRINITY_DN13967_c0_g4_i1.p1 TRINITY_DN13967_c0_g4~~TRINITY_DN13967_c0_g4_i1.p1  ORF type:complete len:293 (+),score=75.68 TRINITY_DN13967_c0_g4_i1:74-952(+)